MNTVLLWGDRWFVSGRPEPLADVPALADHFANNPAPLRLRLIYCPAGFETAAVSCPKGARSTMALALGEEFPALLDEARTWSHEPVLPLRESFTTLLHFESQPALFGLVETLAAVGLQVEAVWPLATWLQALPQAWSESGAQTVAAVDSAQAYAWRHGSDGIRSVRTWHGESAGRELAHWLTALPATEPAEPVLLVGTSPELLEPLAGVTGLAERPGWEWQPLTEALATAATIPKKHPAQLLPPAPWFSAQRLVLAAALVALSLSVWWGGNYAWKVRDARQQEPIHAQLAATRHRAAEATAAELREVAVLDAAMAPARTKLKLAPFLTQLAGTVPAEVTLGSLHVAREGWKLTGFVVPQTNPSVWATWLKRLEPLHPIPGAGPGSDGAFNLSGGVGG